MKIKKTIALIFGGVSPEREVSLISGERVYDVINKNRYNILVYDPKFDISRLVSDSTKIDMALVILHGSFGEDGKVQGLLDLLKIPYQGSGVLSSAVSMDKIISKSFFRDAGLFVPSYMAVRKNELISNLFLDNVEQKLGFPLVVKPVNGGSSFGISIVNYKDQLKKSIIDAFYYENVILLESYLDGIEISCGILGSDKLETLPLVEIIPDSTHVFFDYEAKYLTGNTSEICPARISSELTKKAFKCARIAHDALFCKGYSRSDMILYDDNFYILEVNTIPGMTSSSLFSKSAMAAGIAFEELVDRLINISLQNIGFS